MEPRFRGAKAILVRSFARIHETNLKKQGVLPLTFADPSVYDRVREDDTISVLDLADIKPESSLQCVLHHADGTSEEFTANHTMSPEHIEWFKAGGALNVIRAKYHSN
jgi:aconitate hydratase